MLLLGTKIPKMRQNRKKTKQHIENQEGFIKYANKGFYHKDIKSIRKSKEKESLLKRG